MITVSEKKTIFNRLKYKIFRIKRVEKYVLSLKFQLK